MIWRTMMINVHGSHALPRSLRKWDLSGALPLISHFRTLFPSPYEGEGRVGVNEQTPGDA